MACRPAGMSDEECDDGDFESSLDAKPHWGSNNNWSKLKDNDSPRCNLSSSDEQLRQKEQELQFQVLSACMAGNLEIIQRYIEAGHKVNDFLHTGWTLLLYASSSVQPEVIELLIKNGAKANKSKDGSTPLMEVCKSTDGNTEQCLRCISALIQAKANPNASNKLMQTPLMLACQAREAEVVELLLKHVKDIDATDNEGRTALHYAALGNKFETVQLLLKNNASTTIADRRDLTAREIAGIKGYENIVALLDLEYNECPEDFVKRTSRNTWSDVFPALCSENGALINEDIADLLYGMGLESYNTLFKGMDLNAFVKLTEDDLAKLGMDISLHRQQFIDNLHKFHTKAWSIRSLGTLKKFLPYTLYDGVSLLGNAARQIGVIGSSFEYIKNGFGKARAKGSALSEVQKTEIREELRKTEETLSLLKKDLSQVIRLAKNVEKDNRGIRPAAYIGPKENTWTIVENKYNWTILLGSVVMIGMYLSKTSFVQRLWSN